MFNPISKRSTSTPAAFRERLPGEPSTEQSRTVKRKMLVTYWLGMSLAWIFMVSACKAYGEASDPQSSGFFVWGYALFAMNVVVALALPVYEYERPSSPYISWARAIALTLFATQFFVFMTYVASAYPYSCEFSKYTFGETYNGAEVAENMRNKMVTTKVKWTVEFTTEVCVPVLNWPCTNGGRELFAVLSHLVPIAFMIMSYYAHKFEDLRFFRFTFDMTDVTDYFLLLLEDDIVLNFWGRDQYDASFLEDESTGEGRSNHLWRVIMFFFWTGSLVNIGLMTRRLLHTESIARRRARSGLQTDAERAALRAFERKRCLLSIFLMDLPFLCVRLTCSFRYGIVASTLVMKNIASICMDGINLSQHNFDVDQFVSTISVFAPQGDDEEQEDTLSNSQAHASLEPVASDRLVL